MSRTIAGPSTGGITCVRIVTGSPVTADSATLTDANISPTISTSTGGPVDCGRLATIWFGVEFTAAGSASITLDPLVRDAAAADGSRWKRLLFGPNEASQAAFKPVLDGSGFVEIRVEGNLVFPRIHAVTGNPTAVNILVFPGQPTIGERLPR